MQRDGSDSYDVREGLAEVIAQGLRRESFTVELEGYAKAHVIYVQLEFPGELRFFKVTVEEMGGP